MKDTGNSMKKNVMKGMLPLFCLSQLAQAEVVSTTLNLVSEATFNELGVTIDIDNFQSSSDTSTLTGTVEITIDFDPITGEVFTLDLTGGTISGSQVNFAGNHNSGAVVGSYTLMSNNMAGEPNTIAPPGIVTDNPGFGDFVAADHELIINSGTFTGSVNTIAGNQPVNEDLSVNPAIASGSGTGNIEAFFVSASASGETFEVTLLLPLDAVSSFDVNGTNVDVTTTGTIKAVGQVTVGIPPEITTFEPLVQILENGTDGDLSYNVTGASSLEIDNGVGAVTPVDIGSVTVDPADSTDTEYTLTATGGGGVATAATIMRSVERTTVTYQFIRFTPVRLKEDLPGYPGANSIQIAEFQFFKNDGTNDVQVLPTGVTNPGGNSPGGETPPMVIDGNVGTKWLDFNKGSLIFDFGASVDLDGYQLTTANDSAERDPVAWVLEGSDDQVNWELVDSITTMLGNATREINFALTDDRNTTAQLIPMPSIVATPPATILSFIGDPQILANGETIDLIWDTVGSVNNTIDNGVGSSMDASGTLSATPPDDADTTFTLTADNGAGTLTTGTVSARTVVPGSVSYRYVRFTPIRMAETLDGYSPANSIQIADFNFENNGTGITPVTATNPDGNNPAAEGVLNLLDNDSGTKWLDFNKGGVIFDFGAVATITHYRWTIANDAPERDPVAWRMEGSNDQVNWTVFDEIDKNRSNPSEDISFYDGIQRFTQLPVIPIPFVPGSAELKITDCTFDRANDTVILTFESESGTDYQVQESTDLMSFMNVGDVITATGTETTSPAIVHTGGDVRFFRVVEAP